MKVLLNILFFIIIAFYFSCTKKAAIQEHAIPKEQTIELDKKELIRTFYSNTIRYKEDVSLLNTLLSLEQDKYINQRYDTNWDSLGSALTAFYLEFIIENNTASLIDSIGMDTIQHYVQSNKNYSDRYKLFRCTNNGNVHKAIQEQFFQKLIRDAESKFNLTIDDDCQRFRSGKFESRVSDLFTFQIDRKADQQHTYSLHDDDQWFAKIKWLSNNRFLEMVADRSYPNPNYDTIVVNIYETTDSSYYAISKNVRFGKFGETWIVKTGPH